MHRTNNLLVRYNCQIEVWYCKQFLYTRLITKKSTILIAFTSVCIKICLFFFRRKKLAIYGAVWIQLKLRLRFLRFFFFFFSTHICWLFHGKQYIHALFTDPQIPFFSNFFIKNWSHSTIHIFKNYFATVFSVFSFQFQRNKFYLNRPYIIKIFFFFLLHIITFTIHHISFSLF